jgi:hypothetical protein
MWVRPTRVPRAACLEEMVLAEQPRLRRVTTHLEALSDRGAPRREEVTLRYTDVVEQLRRLPDQTAGAGATPKIHLYQPQSGTDATSQMAMCAGTSHTSFH